MNTNIITGSSSRPRTAAKKARRQAKRLLAMLEHNLQQQQDARKAREAIRSNADLSLLSPSVQRIAEGMKK